ncbi:MAG: acetate--CoA ligase family protein [archaeon]
MGSKIVKGAISAGSEYLSEAEGYQLLKEYGIKFPPYGLAKSDAEAVRIAKRLGFPVVMKVASPQLLHKAEIGGVALGLDSEREARLAFKSLMKRAREWAGKRKGRTIEGILVQKQCAGYSLPLLVGAVTDLVMGKALALSIGGDAADVYTKDFGDIQFRVLPADDSEIQSMRESLHAKRFFMEFRGNPKRDASALDQTLKKLSRMVLENPEIENIELNPLLLFGKAAAAVDVVTVLRRRVKKPEAGRKRCLDALALLNRDSKIGIVGSFSQEPDQSGKPKGRYARMVVDNLIALGYKGIVPVWFNAGDGERYRGFEYCKNASDTKLDIAIIVVSAKKVAGVFDECVKSGAKLVVIQSAGFAETGPIGRRAEEEILKTAKAAGVAVMGPNCLGIFAPKSKIDTMFTDKIYAGRARGGFSLISQSGGVGTSIIDELSKRRLGVSHAFCYGNAMDINETDLLEYLVNDSGTKILAIYLEQIRGKPERFKACVKKLMKRRVPIVVLTPSVSERGAAEISTHTGSVAGRGKILEDFLRHQCGAVLAADIEDLFQASYSLHLNNKHCGLMKGNRVALVSNAGSDKTLISMNLEKNGLAQARFSAAQREEFFSLITGSEIDGIATVDEENNIVLDLTGSVQKGTFNKALEFVFSCKNVDAVAMGAAINTGIEWEELAKKAYQLREKYRKPVVYLEWFENSEIIRSKYEIPAGRSHERCTRDLKNFFEFSKGARQVL